MAAWIICALCAVVILKPQEFISALEGGPLLYVLFGVAAVLSVTDVIRRRVRPALAPHVPFVIAFLAWGTLTCAVKAPDTVLPAVERVWVPLALMLVMTVGLASARGVILFAATFLGCALVVSAVSLVQAAAPSVCMVGDPEDWARTGEYEPDGRPCESVNDCYKDAPSFGANYRCEHAGPWKTRSVEGRIRYRGSLADPNELCVMAASAVPLALAFLEGRRRRRGRQLGADDFARSLGARARLPFLISDTFIRRLGGALRAIPAACVLSAIGAVVVLAHSRTGVIVFIVVTGVTFVRRVGAWGVVTGCLLAPPVLLLGGRSGSEADESADERVDLLAEALQFVRESKGFGVGMGHFPDESSIGMTAHNAYMLAAAETGIVGLCLFGLALYLALKVPLVIWLNAYDVDVWLARMAPALVACLAGTFVGIFFLSWSYKDLLYMLFGASAALYAAARAQDRRVSIGLGLGEAALVCVAMIGLLPAVWVMLALRR